MRNTETNPFGLESTYGAEEKSTASREQGPSTGGGGYSDAHHLDAEAGTGIGGAGESDSSGEGEAPSWVSKIQSPKVNPKKKEEIEKDLADRIIEADKNSKKAYTCGGYFGMGLYSHLLPFTKGMHSYHDIDDFIHYIQGFTDPLTLEIFQSHKYWNNMVEAELKVINKDTSLENWRNKVVSSNQSNGIKQSWTDRIPECPCLVCAGVDIER